LVGSGVDAASVAEPDPEPPPAVADAPIAARAIGRRDAVPDDATTDILDTSPPSTTPPLPAIAADPGPPPPPREAAAVAAAAVPLVRMGAVVVTPALRMASAARSGVTSVTLRVERRPRLVERVSRVCMRGTVRTPGPDVSASLGDTMRGGREEVVDGFATATESVPGDGFSASFGSCADVFFVAVVVVAVVVVGVVVAPLVEPPPPPFLSLPVPRRLFHTTM
jgi:hypothetical protein